MSICLSYLQRERELQFFSSGHESQGEIFFSREHKSQGAGKFSRHLLLAELYCFVQSVRYSSGTFFEEKFMGTIFKEKQFFFQPQKTIQSIHFAGGIEIEVGT